MATLKRLGGGTGDRHRGLPAAPQRVAPALPAGVDARSGRVALRRRGGRHPRRGRAGPNVGLQRRRAGDPGGPPRDTGRSRPRGPGRAGRAGPASDDRASTPPLSPGSGYRLHLRFTGILNDQLHGFYRSTFTADDGVEHVIAVTQFEPADARRAFPCWDEPEFKAVFAVTLVVDEELTALSNASVASEEPAGDGRRRVRFNETMVMSTYLVAFVVGPFELDAAGRR